MVSTSYTNSVAFLRNGKMATPVSVASAAGAGDLTVVKQLLESGGNPSQKSRDGMTPLAVAAFWGYDSIAQLLLKAGADINASNSGTLWTPLHCAAFQGHGKMIMLLMENEPDLYKIDAQGRTAIDFASALDSVWAFFAAAGCKRTPKSDLVRMNIIRKVSPEDPTIHKTEMLTFSRPGSAYIFNDDMRNDREHANLLAASQMGDVLAGSDDAQEQATWNHRMSNPSLAVWNS